MFEYFRIKDQCRKGLLKHLSMALDLLPSFEGSLMLDVGCGTGVPTLFLAERFNGKIIALDPDKDSLKYLYEKSKELQVSQRISPVNSSFFKANLEEKAFDLILAEGFLNVVGFEKGFERLIKLLKSNRFLIIHDELKDNERKIIFIGNHHCRLIGSFILDSNTWWDDYYKCLDKALSLISQKELFALFTSDAAELEFFRNDPSPFTSIYYVIQKL